MKVEGNRHRMRELRAGKLQSVIGETGFLQDTIGRCGDKIQQCSRSLVRGWRSDAMKHSMSGRR